MLESLGEVLEGRISPEKVQIPNVHIELENVSFSIFFGFFTKIRFSGSQLLQLATRARYEDTRDDN